VTDVTGVAATARGLAVSVSSGSVYFQPAGEAPPAGEVPLPFTGVAPSDAESVATDGHGNLYEVLDGHVVIQPIGSPAGTARLVPIVGDAHAVVAYGLGNVYASVAGGTLTTTIARWHPGDSAGATRYQQNDPIGAIAADARGDLFWTETHNGPFAALGSVFRLGTGEGTAQAVPFPNMRDPTGLTASAGGDVYVSSDGGLVRLVRAGAAGSSIVPFAAGVSQVGVDQAGDVFGTSGGRIDLLPAGACQANQVPLTFAAPLNPATFAVDPRGDLFVPDAGAHHVEMFPATGTSPVPACPIRVSGFSLRANGTAKPALRFTLTSTNAHGVRTVTLTLPAGRLRFSKGRALKRGLALRTNRSRHPAFRVRHHGGQQLVVTLKRAARRLSLSFAHGAIVISPMSGFLYGEGPTTITVRGRSGRTIPLSVPTLTH
jgi:hypothetical protein